MHLLKLIGNYFLTEAVGVRVVIIYLQYTLSIINEVVISMWNGDGQKLSPLMAESCSFSSGVGCGIRKLLRNGPAVIMRVMICI